MMMGVGDVGLTIMIGIAMVGPVALAWFTRRRRERKLPMFPTDIQRAEWHAK